MSAYVLQGMSVAAGARCAVLWYEGDAWVRVALIDQGGRVVLVPRHAAVAVTGEGNAPVSDTPGFHTRSGTRPLHAYRVRAPHERSARLVFAADAQAARELLHRDVGGLMPPSHLRATRLRSTCGAWKYADMARVERREAHLGGIGNHRS